MDHSKVWDYLGIDESREIVIKLVSKIDRSSSWKSLTEFVEDSKFNNSK